MLAGLGYRKLNKEYFIMLNEENMELVVVFHYLIVLYSIWVVTKSVLCSLYVQKLMDLT